MKLDVVFTEKDMTIAPPFGEQNGKMAMPFGQTLIVKGEDGATFLPVVTPIAENAVRISFTNNKGLENPEPIEIIAPRGTDGRDGVDGKDGYTPVKGIDYRDGIDGKDGETGPQGERGETGPQGPPGETGPQGPAGATGPQGERGEKGDAGPAGADGSDGRDGYTPVRGEDYWTDADRAEMVRDVRTALDTPLDRRTWQDIRYSASAVYNRYYPIVKFGEIQPVDFGRPCWAKFRLYVTVNNTSGSIPIALTGIYDLTLYYTQDVVSSTNLVPRYKYMGFELLNRFPSASYRPVYFLVTRGLNAAGLAAGCSIPFGWHRSPSEYAYNTCTRDITIEVTDCENCSVTLVDEIAHANTAGFLGSGDASAYDTITLITGAGAVGGRHTGDQDTYYRITDNAEKQIVDYPLYRYDLLLEKLDGTFAPLRANNKSVTTANGGVAVPNTTTAFKTGGRILYYTTTAEVALNGSTFLTDIEYTADGRYMSTNAQGTSMKIDGEPLAKANARALYLKVRDNGDCTFSLDASLPADLGYHFTQKLPTENDGYLYIQIGRMVNHLYQYRLTATHDIYWHDGERLRRY